MSYKEDNYISNIHTFAVKWFDLFKNSNSSCRDLESDDFAKDCFSLNFKMDCEESFIKKYGNTSHDAEKLKEIINDVEDVQLLGSLIFSSWRYFTHWCTYQSISDTNTREYFLVALNRLSEISK